MLSYMRSTPGMPASMRASVCLSAGTHPPHTNWPRFQPHAKELWYRDESLVMDEPQTHVARANNTSTDDNHARARDWWTRVFDLEYVQY